MFGLGGWFPVGVPQPTPAAGLLLDAPFKRVSSVNGCRAEFARLLSRKFSGACRARRRGFSRRRSLADCHAAGLILFSRVWFTRRVGRCGGRFPVRYLRTAPGARRWRSTVQVGQLKALWRQVYPNLPSGLLPTRARSGATAFNCPSWTVEIGLAAGEPDIFRPLFAVLSNGLGAVQSATVDT